MNKNYLIVVDVQNDFIDGALGSKEAQAVLPNICNVIRNHKGPVIATMDTHVPGEYGLEFRTIGIPHCLYDHLGWHMPEEVLNALNYQGCFMGYVKKNSYGSIDLVDAIKNIEKSIVLCPDVIPTFTIIGLDTDICVVSNALILRAAFPESEITVYTDCCAGSTPQKHNQALAVMQSCNIVNKVSTQ